MLWFLSFFKRCVFLEYISKIFFKKGLENVPPLWNKIISNFMTIVIWITVIFIIKKSPIVIPNFKMIMLIAITSSLYQIFLYALSKGKVALVGTVVSIYPALTVILAMRFLKEKLIKRQLAAVGLTVVGLIFMGISIT